MKDFNVHRIFSSFTLILTAQMLFLTGTANADFNPKNWKYYREIESADSTGQYAQVIINREMYCKSANLLSDLRIIDGKKKEIPYELMVDQGQTEEVKYTPALLNKSLVKGSYTTFVLDLIKPGIINNGITIHTPSKNFMYRVEIDGGQDINKLAVLRDDAYIFDFSQNYEARSTNITYPENTFRYIRVRIWHYGGKPVDVSNVEIQHIKTQPTRETILYRGKGSITQNKDEQITDILVDMGCSGLPGKRLTISSPDTNYHRRIAISGSDNKTDWIELGYGHILKYNTPKFKGEESSIEYMESQNRYIRVRILNYDSAPIKVSDVTLYATRRRIFFPYSQNNSYRLYYGNPEARTPVYDLQEMIKYIPSQAASVLKIRPEMKNSDFVAPISTEPWLKKNPWVLWVVLVAAVVILGLFTIKLVKQTKESLTNPPH